MSEEQKNMILGMAKCSEAPASLNDLLMQMLQGVNGVRAEEWFGKVAAPKRSVTLQVAGLSTMAMPPPPLDHWVTVVNIPNPTRSFVLDTTGAQYGHFKACQNLREYRKERGEGIESRKTPVGTNKDINAAIALQEGTGALIVRKERAAADVLYTAVRHCENSTGLSLPDLLRQAERVFNKNRSELLNAVASSLDSYVSTANFSADVKTAFFFDCANPGQSVNICTSLARDMTKRAHVFRKVDIMKDKGIHYEVEETDDEYRFHRIPK